MYYIKITKGTIVRYVTGAFKASDCLDNAILWSDDEVPPAMIDVEKCFPKWEITTVYTSGDMRDCVRELVAI